jgi:hypothetical protein
VGRERPRVGACHRGRRHGRRRHRVGGNQDGHRPRDPLEESVTSPVALRYDTVHDYFVYTYRAPQYGCYVLGIRRADGLTAKQWRFLFVP